MYNFKLNTGQKFTNTVVETYEVLNTSKILPSEMGRWLAVTKQIHAPLFGIT